MLELLEECVSFEGTYRRSNKWPSFIALRPEVVSQGKSLTNVPPNFEAPNEGEKELIPNFPLKSLSRL